MSTERILVVDDDPAILTLCQRILEADGFVVTTAIRGEDAWNKLESEPFDLLLTDIRLPGIDGLELITRIRERGLDMVIITMTGYSNMDMAIQALSLGVDEFIIKPFMPDSLRVHVARVLEKSKLLGENSRLWMLLPLLRAPLSTILTNARQLGESASGESAALANQILEDANHLERLVRDLVGANYLRRGMFPVRIEHCPVNRVVNDIIEAYRPMANEKEQTLELNIPENAGALMADRALLDLMLGSVLFCILRLAPRHARFFIVVKGDADTVILSVREHEHALMIQAAPRASTLPNATRHALVENGNTAPGLGWTRDMIRQHGGKLWVESEPGQTQIFYVMLPRHIKLD